MTIRMKDGKAIEGACNIYFGDGGRGWCEGSHGKRTTFYIKDIEKIEE